MSQPNRYKTHREINEAVKPGLDKISALIVKIKSGPYPYKDHKEEFDDVIAFAEEAKNKCLDDAARVYRGRPVEYFGSDFFKLQEYILAAKLAKSGIPFVNKDEITIIEGSVLGKGSFGVAKKCVIQGKEYVLKEVKKEFDPEYFEPKSLINNVDGTYEEFLAARMGTHPNVVSLYGFTLEPFGIVMEFAECGDLKSYVEKNFGTLDFTKKYRIAAGIADGFDWLTNVSGVVHRDIKPENILLDGTLTSKVSDFGIVRILRDIDDTEFEYAGNKLYSPPELFEIDSEGRLKLTGTTDKSCVVYGYGLVLFFIMTGKEPYTETDNIGSIEGLLKKIKKVGHPKYPYDVAVPSKFVKLINKCISKDIATRPNFDTIREELWDAYMDAEFLTKEGTSLEEPKGFWKERFRRKIEVPLEEIIPVADVSDKAKGILCGGPSRTVTIHRFLLLYRSFGRWYDPSSPDHAKTFELISQEWFMEDQGSIPVDRHPEGTFYVRIASAGSGAPFAVERINGGKATKFRIFFNNETKKYKSGKLEFEYDSVIDLIEGHKEGLIIETPYRPIARGYT